MISVEPPREAAELRCRCGYGIVVDAEPPACPMCRLSAWLTPSGRRVSGSDAHQRAELLEREGRYAAEWVPLQKAGRELFVRDDQIVLVSPKSD